MLSGMFSFKTKEEKVSLTLRLGLAFVFIYTSISAILNPIAWIGFMPQFLGEMKETFLIVHDIGLILLGVWLVSNKKVYYASVISAIFLLAVVVFNWGAMDIIYRDIGLFLMAVALAFLSKKK
jgi:hypothetical protein